LNSQGRINAQNTRKKRVKNKLGKYWKAYGGVLFYFIGAQTSEGQIKLKSLINNEIGKFMGVGQIGSIHHIKGYHVFLNH